MLKRNIYKKKKQKKPSSKKIWEQLIQSGIIGLFISITLIIVQGMNDSQLQQLQTKSQEYISNIQLEHKIFLSSLQQENLEDLEKIKNIFSKELAGYQSELELYNQLITTQKEIEGNLEAIKSQQLANIEENRKQVEFNIAEQKGKNKLDFITKQLSEFYWPVLYRLEKNNSVYSMLSNSFVGKQIDANVILPNHIEILEIIEKKIHLAQPDDALLSEINGYIEHVNMYQMLRQGGYNGFPEDYNGTGFDDKLYKIIRSRTEYLQIHYEKLLKINNLSDSLPLDSLNSIPFPINSSKDYLFNTVNHDIRSYEIQLKHKTEKDHMYKISKDSLTIAFKNYIPDSEFCIIEIGHWNDVFKNKGRKVHLRKSVPYNYSYSNGSNYQISLEEVWKESKYFTKDKIKASLRVEEWSQNSNQNIVNK